MARKSSIVTIAAAVLWLCATPPAEAGALAHGHGEQQIDIPGVGPVMIFRPPSTAESLALFLSPAAGWSEWDTSVARQLAKADTLVAGIDTRQFLTALNEKSGECVDPAAPLEDLATFLKKEFAIREFIQPMLVGHTEGGNHCLQCACPVQSPQLQRWLGDGVLPCPAEPTAALRCPRRERATWKP